MYQHCSNHDPSLPTMLTTHPHYMKMTSRENGDPSRFWLDQEDYFFDDEFAGPYDEDALIDPSHCPTDPSSNFMTCPSANGDQRLNSIDHSFSASYHQTPADSGDSRRSMDVRNAQVTVVPSNFTNPLILKPPFPAGIPTEFSGAFGESGIVPNQPFNLARSVTSQQSIDGSQASGPSESTSWMQLLMERSCNPNLKALLNRAAATVDYKLAYADSMRLENSTNSQINHMIRDDECTHFDCNNNPVSNLPRSLSDDRLFSPTSLSGLKNALEQATLFIPQLHKQPICCDPDDQDPSIQPTVTTTWAKTHGSRESLKRKNNQNKHGTVLPKPTNLDHVLHPVQQTPIVNPWRAMKEASGTLITWNQLKRTMKVSKPVQRVSTMHESRREKYNRHTENAYPSESPIADKINVSSDTQIVSNLQQLRPCNRSRSQPVPGNHYMHRFSGTLLEIFMRARTEDQLLHQEENKLSFHDEPVAGTLRSVGCTMTSSRMSAEACKHPSLRGDHILPTKWHPTEILSTVKPKRHFGTQFPPTDNSVSNDPLPAPLRSASPPWTVQTTRNLGNVGRPDTARTPGRPQSLGNDRLTAHDPSRVPVIEYAACLTASAGPDSDYMAALRADFVAGGFAPGWIGNPRASIAYPGLGIVALPRPSRLTGASFLSHTLPNLSFLSQAGAEEERMGTPTMSKRVASTMCCCRRHHHPHKCGNRSQSAVVTPSIRSRTCPSSRTKRPELKAHAFSIDDVESPNGPRGNQVTNVQNNVPDLVADHQSGLAQRGVEYDRIPSNRQLRLFRYRSSVRTARSNSEPDLHSLMCASTLTNSHPSNDPSSLTTAEPTDEPLSYNRQDVALMTSSYCCEYAYTSSNRTSRLSDDDIYGFRRPKKSVSFNNDQLPLIRGPSGIPSRPPDSPEPKVIPRNWGLYGQETPLAEFNARNSPGRDSQQAGVDLARQSDVDVRYHAMVNDVIKAVQETVAYYSRAHRKPSNPGSSSTSISSSTSSSTTTKNGEQFNRDPITYSTAAALGSTGRQPLLAVIGPLTVLLSDGLLPPTKLLFTTKPRTRLWQMVEESCRQSPLLNGVTYRVLADAYTQVRSLPSVTVEKARFRAFLCACLNAKALPMWLNVVVANEILLNKFYCEDAFVRQCRANHRGLYADLLTHLEQLLAFPFNLDVTVEARKPVADPYSSVPSSRHGSTVVPSISANKSPMAQHKVSPRSSAPPAVVLPRRSQPTVVAPTRTRFSPPVVGSTAIPSAPVNSPVSSVNHYPSHHLPGQRPVQMPKSTVPTNQCSRNRNTFDTVFDGSNGNGTRKFSVKSSTTAQHLAVRDSLSSPPVRDRFKTALSTFRRTSVIQVSSDSSSVDPEQTQMPTTAPIGSRKAAPVPSNTPKTVKKGVSKLKQPTLIIGPR